MNKKIFSLSLFAIALAGLFLFAAPNGSIAASDNYNNTFSGSINHFGVDEAYNGGALAGRDYDRPSKPDFQSYGLHGDWEPGGM
ncbi:exported hypothetical protein [Syntrophobacter sp. SbD1]|nr:exported hypothetical protein [Syntrophobacter sp. SbD1]